MGITHLAAIGLLILVLVLPYSVANAASTITVTTTTDELNNDGDCSLREAVRAANTDSAVDACAAGSGADTIMVPTGYYNLTLFGNSENGGATGDLDLVGTVTFVGTGSNLTFIDGQKRDRVLDIMAGATVTLKTITVRSGKAPAGSNGGVVYNAGSLTTIRSKVTSGQVTSKDGVGNNGGGIYNLGTLNITDQSTIGNNRAVEGSGGGIYNAAGGTIKVLDSTFDINTAKVGGTIDNQGTTTLLRSLLRYGLADYGGGIRNRGFLNINRSTLTSSAWIDGGVIYNENASVTLVNTTITGGVAFRNGAGIWTSGAGPVVLHNVTLHGNQADHDSDGVGNGGGIYTDGGNVTLDNTIVGGNTDLSGEMPDCSGTIKSQGYNLVGNAAGCTITGDTTGNVVGVDSIVNYSYYKKGILIAYLPEPGSPAIDGGNPAAPGSSPTACRMVDEFSVARPIDGDGDGVARCDIGAMEVKP